MSLRLISHINADSDLIEAWLKYYIALGIEHFHFVLHGDADDNLRLLSIKDSYPITIEDEYQGPFLGDYKKSRLDAVLARYTGQWIVLVDSDEFVEFPYRDIPETVRMLSQAGANLMAAPMLQRLTADGSLETPSVIDDPFQMFPLCSVDLYRRMGVKGDIFKYPLFFCAAGIHLAEEGNHHPPLGCEPRASGILGVTHHFKFRRAVSQRLHKRINSAYLFRQESVGFQGYLESHSNLLPLDGSFIYSREELFRRRLLRTLPPSKPGNEISNSQGFVECHAAAESARKGIAAAVKVQESETSFKSYRDVRRKIMCVLPKTTEFGGLEKHLLAFLSALKEQKERPLIVCFDQEIISAFMSRDQLARIDVKCVCEPKSLWDWILLIRQLHPDTIVFC